MKDVYCLLEFSIDSNSCDYHLCRTEGEAQLPEEGRMIPSCNICSNSFLAILSLTGESLLVGV